MVQIRNTGYSDQTSARISHLPMRANIPDPLHTWYVHTNNVWWGVQNVELLIPYIFPVSCHFIPLKYKLCLLSTMFLNTLNVFFL
jgi:hypothetical protein